MSSNTDIIDFLIVGGGIAGASLGYHLAPNGRTVVLEMESQPGYHTTGRSAAFYAESYGGSAIQPLTSASKAFLHSPPDGFSDVPLITDRGAIHIFADDQRHLVTRLYEEMKADLPGVTLLERQEVTERLPMIRPERVAGGIADPDCGDLDVAAIHQGYLRGLRKAGGTVLGDTALTSASREDGIWTVQTTSGDLQCKALINAAGAWVDEVAEKAGLTSLGFVPLQRTIVQTPADEKHQPEGPVIIDLEERFYFKPEANGWLVCPADETPSPPCDAQPDIENIAWAAHWFGEMMVSGEPAIENKWAGLRTFAADRKPVIGFDPRVEGFFWSAGQGGYGIQTADGWSRLAAALVLGQPVPDDLTSMGADPALYRPDRFI